MNQNQTHRVELKGGFLWSPKTARGGRRHYFYDTMTELVPGYIIFSFFDTFIQAVGVVQGRAITAPKPEFGAAGDPWDSVGWLVEVDYWHLPAPFRPREHMQSLAPYFRQSIRRYAKMATDFKASTSPRSALRWRVA